MDGRLYPKSISRAFPTKILLDAAEIFLLAGIGAAGVLLHAYLRIPMKLPGHHGVIFMALLLSGRLISKKNFASSFSSIGAAAMLLVPLGFKDPFIPVIYMFPGFVVDIFFNNIKTIRPKVFFLAIVCGLAYMTIPVTRIFITLTTGFPYGAFITGFFYPLIMHFVFGFTGGLIPAGIRFFTRKKK